MKVLSVANLKGGVAKTVTTVNMACKLANHGIRVLVLDNDPQGNASQTFYVFNDNSNLTSGGLIMEDSFTADSVRAFIQHTNNKLIDVIASNRGLAWANKMGMMESCVKVDFISRYREALSQVAEDYDVCIIDNGPAMCLSFEASLIAADDVIIPADASKYSYTGLEQMKGCIESIRYKKNPKLNVLGVLITKYRKDAHYDEGVKWLRESGNMPIMNTRIRYSSTVDRSTYEGDLDDDNFNTVGGSSPRSNAAKDYESLTLEYMAAVGLVSKKGGADHE